MYHIDMIYTIKTLLDKGHSQRAVSRQLGISRKTVKKYVLQIQTNVIEEPTINRSKQLDQYNNIITQWYEKGLTALLIYNRLNELYSLDISYPSVARYVKELKKSEVFIPLISKPAEEAQVDYGYMGRFTKAGKDVKVWCFVITLSFSRLQYVELVTDQSVTSFLKSHRNAFEFFGGVPQTVKIDNLKAGVLHASFYEAQIQTQYAEFLQHYGSMPITARVRRPQDKGKVEAGVKFVENNFLKNLEHRNFIQAQKDLQQWVEKANLRVHGTIKKVPKVLFEKTEKQYLIALPENRFELYSLAKRRVNNYAHISFNNNYYSVPAVYASKEVIIKYTENTLKIYDNQTQIALHAISSEQGVFITQEHHKPIGKHYKNQTYYLDKSAEIGDNALAFSKAVIERKPHDYQKIINGICHLAKKHGNHMVNQACERSLSYGAISYISIKHICEKNLVATQSENLQVNNAGGFHQDLAAYDNLILN